jgi:hypothetical protein
VLFEAHELARDDPVLRSHISLGVASCPFNSKKWDNTPNSDVALKLAKRQVQSFYFIFLIAILKCICACF